MAKKQNNKPSQAKRYEDKLVRTVDDLAAFDEFAREVLPALRADLAKGLSAKEMREKYTALAEARRISMIATSGNESAVNAAIKDLLDRTEGKPKEVQEIEHRLGKLPEEQLDAILESELTTLKEMKGQDDDS